MRHRLLTLDFPPMRGGVARYLDGLAQYFRDSIHVIAPPMEGAEAFDATCGYVVERVPLINTWVAPHWAPAVSTLFMENGDYDTVVVSHVLPMGTAAWVAKIFTRKPYVVIVHGMDVALASGNLRKRWIAGVVLRGAKAVVCNSKALEKEVKHTFGVRETIVCYPSLAAVGTRNHVGLRNQSTSIRLLTVSRLVERKGHMRVLEALAQLKAVGKGELVSSYTIVGSGPMQAAIQESVQKLGLASVVRLIGDVHDAALTALYAESDVFVMPTIGGSADREGFGLVYVEAAAYGVPSIASNLPGVDEAVMHGQTGLLIPDGDIDALTEAIEHLAKNPIERRQMGEAAQIRASFEFSAEKQFGKLKRLL